jgi:hypothetical protein
MDKNYQRSAQSGGSWLVRQDVKRAEFLGFVGMGFNALFTSRSRGRRWIDHTPGYTLMADDLSDMFPGAYFLHILRDGRRVVHSMINFLSALTKEERLARQGLFYWTEFRNGCRTWREYVEKAMAFCARNPSRCLTLINEELVLRPQEEFAKIFKFIGVPIEEQPALYSQSFRINSSFKYTAEGNQLVKNVNDIWNQWSSEQQQIFGEEAGPTLKKYCLHEMKVDMGSVPATIPPTGFYEGYIDVSNDQEISGWVWDERQPNRPMSVDVYDGSKLLATVLADQFREDLLAAGKGNGRHGFQFSMPPEIRVKKVDLISIKLAGSALCLPNT